MVYLDDMEKYQLPVNAVVAPLSSRQGGSAASGLCVSGMTTTAVSVTQRRQCEWRGGMIFCTVCESVTLQSRCHTMDDTCRGIEGLLTAFPVSMLTGKFRKAVHLAFNDWRPVYCH